METKIPKIRGLFVNSHIRALNKLKGPEAVMEIQKIYGSPLKFGNFQYAPVKDEVKIIDLVLHKLASGPIASDRIDYEAGRLHFKDFLTTIPARLLFPVLGRNFKLVMWVARIIAPGIFSGVKVHKENAGVHTEKITMENSDHPIEHFTGFFDAWLEHLKLIGLTTGRQISPGVFEYAITWKKRD